jgi:hypothetical protein
MKYFVGFIVGVALTVGGAWLYDSAAADKLVNWATAYDMVQAAVKPVKDQIGKLIGG